MPGLIGWIQCDKEPLAYPQVIDSLLVNAHQKWAEINGIDSGRLALVHPDINPVGQGSASDAATGRLLAYWGEFYGPQFSNCRSSSEMGQTLLSYLGDQPVEKLAQLDGSFVLFWQEPGRQILAVDRTASRPLYYMQVEGGLAFGPELKTFSFLKAGRPPLERNAIVSFVTTGAVIFDHTYFRGVQLLRPGFLLQVKGKSIATQQYTEYIPADPSAKDLGLASYEEQLAGILRQAIRKRSSGLETAVVPISGGYDSRGILACIREFYSGPLKTVSWGCDENDPVADPAVGRRLADFYGTDHQFLRRESAHLIKGLQQSIHGSDACNTDSLLHPHEPALMEQLRSSGYPLLFRGDECFGYDTPSHSAMEALAKVGIRGLSQFPGIHKIFHPSQLPAILEEQSAGLDELIASCPEFENWTVTKDWLSLSQGLFRNLGFSHYDKLCILEARNPWLDRDVLAFYATVPVTYRESKRLYCSTLTKMFPKLMSEIPIATKNGEEEWEKQEANEREFLRFARENLTQGTTPLHDIFSATAISDLIDSCAAGRSVETLRVRLMTSIKPFARNYLSPMYRSLKRRAPPSVVAVSTPVREIIGRLVILKLWCDHWA